MVILIGFSLTVAIGFLIAFLWAVKSGQYDDRYTPAMRILFDNNKPQNSKSNNKHTNKTNKQLTS
ncbi:MAG: cbb3-type cytochrome oxidase assembly protein CcoS [Melioribacteraceae bacterium]|nr:cbb3-type cytochrome oxidase assembly protein CcoS [Melioribacteraceae bacterium]